MKKQTGFTLIELIIGLVIFSIMAALAAPNYGAFVRSNRQTAAYNTLVGTISLARLEAVKSSRVVTLCISSNQSSCDGTTNEWNNGWIVFSDFDGDGVVDTADGDTILKSEVASGRGLTIRSAAFPSSITIAPRGRLRSQGSFVICDSSGEAENGMALNLWVTGLGRLATDDDDDDIVEDLANDPISCPSTGTSD